MKPGDDEQVEMIEDVELVDVDIFTEFDEARGVVLLTIAPDDRDEDIVVLLTGAKARAAGDSLFRLGCRAP